MNAQIITTPGGERMVLLPEADYRRLLAAAEDAVDLAAVKDFQKALTAGEEELLPDAMVARLVDGDNPIRVWREHRGLSVTELAAKAGLSQPYLSQIENGTRRASAALIGALASALGVSPDELV
jgi:ribosome-binding protein aMBF1 (putative translation factor)